MDESLEASSADMLYTPTQSDLATSLRDPVIRRLPARRTAFDVLAGAAFLIAALLFIDVAFEPHLAPVARALTASGWGWVAFPFVLIGSASEHDVWTAMILTVAGGLLLVVSSARIAVMTRTRPVRVMHSLNMSPDRLNLELQQMNVSFIQARFFAQCLARPADRFARITESVEAGTRSVRDAIAVSISTRGLRAGEYVAPVLLCTRGQLENGLRFHCGGERVSSLTHLQATAFSLLAIRRLLASAGGTALERYLARDDESMESRVRAQLSSTSREADDLYKQVTALQDGSPGDALIKAAAAVVYVLTEQYAVCLVIDVDSAAPEPPPAPPQRWSLIRHEPLPSPTRSIQPANAPMVRVGIERIVVPSLARPSSARGRWTHVGRSGRFWVRSILGISPHSLDHSTALAARTPAFHLAIRGPEGTYLSRQELRHESGQPLTRIELGDLKYSMYPRRGQRTAHLYARHPTEHSHFEQPGGSESVEDSQPQTLSFDKLSFACKFYERMPGSMATVLVASLSTFVISATIAIAALYVRPEINAPVADVSGLLQILLAFPFALTATSSFRRGGALWDGDLGARAASALTIGVLVASLIISTIGPMLGSREVVVILWAAILLVSLSTTVATLAAWISRAITQATFTRR